VEPYLPAELHDTVMDSLLAHLTQNLEKRRASRDLFTVNPNLENERQTLRLSTKQLMETFAHIAAMFESCPDSQIVLDLVNVVKELKAKLPPIPGQTPAAVKPTVENAEPKQELAAPISEQPSEAVAAPPAQTDV